MRLVMNQPFPCSPEELTPIFDSPAFHERMAQRSAVVRELIEERDESDASVSRWRVTAKREIPAAMAKMIGSKHIVYEQESRRDKASGVLHWTITPMVLADKFSGAGTTIVRATAGGCERVIEGELTVKVPLLGKKMEGKLVENVQESYAKAAEIALELLQERRGS